LQESAKIAGAEFSELVELISKYDRVLGKHCSKECKDNWYFLSPQIINEFIGLLCEHVNKSTFNQLHDANYFAVIRDSKAGNTHVDN